MRPIILATACLFTTIAAVAGQPQQERERAWTAPAAADSRQNPLPSQPGILAGGKKVFHQRCSVCHGEDGTGSNRGPNLMTVRVQGQSDGALFWKISSGNTRTGMPGFSFLPEAQRWQLVMHLRAGKE
ncbi:MAG TPA: c-type cytochrome [Vicinamibacterales bacterium]|nr:c-type cytochrome [Vicinamibacterales bacterium]